MARDDIQPREGASHDRAVPPTLAECFTQGWVETAPAVPVLPGAAYAATRRALLSARFPGSESWSRPVV